MYQIGQGQGKSYDGQQGTGAATTISFPKIDSIAMWKMQKNEEKDKLKQAQLQSERAKALGILDSFKPDWFYLHNKDLTKELGGFVDKTSKTMLTQNNPFDAATPSGNELIKQKDRIESLMKLSQNQRQLYSEYSKIKKDDFTPESIQAYEKYLSANIYDLESGKIPMAVLEPRNPINTEMAVFSSPEFAKAKEDAAKTGEDLVDSPALKFFIKDKMSDPNVISFYDTKFKLLSPEKQKEITDKAIEKKITEDRDVSVGEIMAEDFLTSTLPRTPFDETKVIKELAGNLGDNLKEIERGDKTITSKNLGKEVESNALTVAKDFLLSDSPDAVRSRKSKGLTKEDVLNNTAKSKEYVSYLGKRIGLAKEKIYKEGFDEMKSWMAKMLEKNDGGESLFQQFMDDVTNNNQNSMPFGVLKGESLGAEGVIKDIEPQTYSLAGTGDDKYPSVKVTLVDKMGVEKKVDLPLNRDDVKVMLGKALTRGLKAKEDISNYNKEGKKYIPEADKALEAIKGTNVKGTNKKTSIVEW